MRQHLLQRLGGCRSRRACGVVGLRRRRFGLGDKEPETLAEIGADMNLSRERIRQLEERALNKLRRSRRARQLLGYLN